MNRYLSSRERENMARLMALVMVEGEAIKNYEKGSNLDKEFMKYLRMSHTFLEKAIARRYNLLDLEDLCECIMPRLCGVCSGKNFRHCAWKEFLHRYQVEVVNYKADENTCPYSYPQAGWTVSKEWAEEIQKPFGGIVSDSDTERTEGR